MSPSFSVFNRVCWRGVVAAAVVAACGSTAALADVISISSANVTGPFAIRALAASSVPAGVPASGTVDYGAGDTWQFSSFTSGTFAAAQTAAAASLVTTTGVTQSAWNNGMNNSNNWTGVNSAAMNAAEARWISAGSNDNPTPTTSVLFAIPFDNSSGHTLANITFSFVTDNGAGSTNGANNTATTPGFLNGGLFLNGSDAQVSYTSALNSGNNPAQFQTIITLNFSGVTLLTGQNWLYFHQFNWGGFGGSAFAATITTVVPLPAPVWGGIAGLAGVGGLAAIRRRRTA